MLCVPPRAPDDSTTIAPCERCPADPDAATSMANETGTMTNAPSMQEIAR